MVVFAVVVALASTVSASSVRPDQAADRPLTMRGASRASANSLDSLSTNNHREHTPHNGQSTAISTIPTRDVTTSLLAKHDDDDDDDSFWDELAKEVVAEMLEAVIWVFVNAEGSDGTHLSLTYGYAHERQQRDLVLHAFDLTMFKRFNFAGGEPIKGDTWGYFGFGFRLGGHGSSDEARGADEERLSRIYLAAPFAFGIQHDWRASPWHGAMGAAEVGFEFGLTGGNSIDLANNGEVPALGRSQTRSSGLRGGLQASVGYSIVTAFASMTAESYPGGTFHDRTYGFKLGPPLLNVLSLTIGRRDLRYLGARKDFEYLALTLAFRF